VNLSLGRRARVAVRLGWAALPLPGAVILMVATSAVPRTAPGYPAVAYWMAGVLSLVNLSVLGGLFLGLMAVFVGSPDRRAS
jgi:hypothetical protein